MVEYFRILFFFICLASGFDFLNPFLLNITFMYLWGAVSLLLLLWRHLVFIPQEHHWHLFVREGVFFAVAFDRVVCGGFTLLFS